MNENSGNNLIPRAFPSVLVKSLGTNFACGNYNYRYFLFGLKVTITGILTIIVILRSLTHIPTHTLALALTLTLTLTLTLQEDINLLSKGKCLESKFILFILATKKYYFVPCVDPLLEKYRVEFNMSVYIDWCILKRPVTRAVIKTGAPNDRFLGNICSEPSRLAKIFESPRTAKIFENVSW